MLRYRAVENHNNDKTICHSEMKYENNKGNCDISDTKEDTYHFRLYSSRTLGSVRIGTLLRNQT